VSLNQTSLQKDKRGQAVSKAQAAAKNGGQPLPSFEDHKAESNVTWRGRMEGPIRKRKLFAGFFDDPFFVYKGDICNGMRSGFGVMEIHKVENNGGFHGRRVVLFKVWSGEWHLDKPLPGNGRAENLIGPGKWVFDKEDERKMHPRLVLERVEMTDLGEETDGDKVLEWLFDDSSVGSERRGKDRPDSTEV